MAKAMLLPMVMIAINDLAFNLIIYTVFFVMRNKMNLVGYLEHVIIPEILYTVLATLVLYKIFAKINSFLKKSEEGGTI